jgi:hypothetical protein
MARTRVRVIWTLFLFALLGAWAIRAFNPVRLRRGRSVLAPEISGRQHTGMDSQQTSHVVEVHFP